MITWKLSDKKKNRSLLEYAKPKIWLSPPSKTPGSKLIFPSRPGPEHCYWIEDFNYQLFAFPRFFCSSIFSVRLKFMKGLRFLKYFSFACFLNSLLQCFDHNLRLPGFFRPMVTLFSKRSSCGGNKKK